MKKLNIFYIVLFGWLIFGCSRLNYQLAIVQEVYKNEIDPSAVQNDEIKKNLALLSKGCISRINKGKQKNLSDYISYVENQKKLNLLSYPTCKATPIQPRSLPDYNRVEPIELRGPSSPALRNQIEMTNQSNEQFNQQRIEERLLKNHQMEMESQANALIELQKCKADSISKTIQIRSLQLENYLKLQIIGNQIKMDFLRANRKASSK